MEKTTYRGTFLLLGARHIITSLDMSNSQPTGRSHTGAGMIPRWNDNVFPKPTWFRRHGGIGRCLVFFLFQRCDFQIPWVIFCGKNGGSVNLLGVAPSQDASGKWRFLGIRMLKMLSWWSLLLRRREPHPMNLYFFACEILAVNKQHHLHLFNFGVSHQVDSNP